MSNGNELSAHAGPSSEGRNGALDSHHHARDIIRLIQCPLCSHILRTPVRLPCGNSICRECLPPTHKRVNVTYPAIERRATGIHCPFKEDTAWELGTVKCGVEHALDDCGVDVVMCKIVEIFGECVREYGLREPGKDDTLLSVESAHRDGDAESLQNGSQGEIETQDDELIQIYMAAERGELPYTANDVHFHTAGGVPHDEMLGKGLFVQVKSLIRNELDCQVCFAFIQNPFTTACGHTFCRNCITQSLDHSDLCPICRRKLPMMGMVDSEPGNRILSRIIETLFPEELAARLESSRADELNPTETGMIPLFVCTLAFPAMPTYLHIFEPRYRIMIRRVMQSGSRKFGMVIYNRARAEQGELGASPFLQYGTMLQVERFELLPDGRSFVKTVGTGRFKVVEYDMMDGYYVGKIERVDDIPISEEALEAQETAIPAPEPAEGDDPMASVPIDRLSTQQLLQIGLDFVADRRENIDPWLRDRVLAAFGPAPTDAALFPYWLGSVLPISELERYSLLPARSVRERLKITVGWVRKLENSNW